MSLYYCSIQVPYHHVDMKHFFSLVKPTTLRLTVMFFGLFFPSGVFSDGNLTYGIEPAEGGEVSPEFQSFHQHKLQAHLFSRRPVFNLAIRVPGKMSVFWRLDKTPCHKPLRNREDISELKWVHFHLGPQLKRSSIT